MQEPVSLAIVHNEVFPQRLVGLGILVVDDMTANADALRELLKLEGAEVSVSYSAGDALERLARERFDVVITDVAMPGMSGHDLVTAMRATESNAATPAIAYSGYGGAGEQRLAREAGFDAHLTKPASLDAFVDVIRRTRAARAVPRKTG